MSALAVAALAVGIVGVAVAATAPPDAQADEPCVLTAVLVNPCRPMLGANAGAYPNVPSGLQPQIAGHEARIGRQVDVVHLYRTPGTRPLNEDDRFFIARPDTILSVTWKPATVWREAGGSNETVNAEIDAAADDIKSLGSTKIMLTIFHEPENDVSGGAEGCADTTYVGDSGTPAEYRAMWKNVRDRFHAKGVTNAVFVMNYMGFVNYDCMIDDLWPGNDLVDWVMWDPYSDSVPWNTTVGRLYDFLVANSDATHDYASKPWGLAEWSVWRNATRAFTYQYYDDARASIARNDFPRLKLYSIFDNAVNTPRTSRIGYDSKGVFDQVEIDHYAALANDPAFVGAWSPPAPPEPDTQPPTAPAALTAAEPTPYNVRLQWDASTDDVWVHHYELQRNGEIVDDTVIGVTFDDTTVEPATSYSYRVRAIDTAGNAGPWSDDLSVDIPEVPPDTQAPSVPGALTVSSSTSARIDLRWFAATDDTGIDHYEVARDAAVVDDNVTALTFTDTTVQAATSYTYTVRAIDAAGNVGAWSAELVVDVPAVEPPPDTEAPSAPGSLTVTEVGFDHAALSWTAATDDVGVDHYELSRNGTVIADELRGLSFIDTTVQPETSYDYAVRAVDAAGNTGPATTVVDVTTPAPPDTTAPTAPTSLATSQNAYNRVALQWQAATDNVAVNHYEVLRGTAVIAANVTSTTYADAAAQPSTDYTYTVRAVDAAGNVGPASTGLAVRTPAPPDTTAPTAPTSVGTAQNAYNRVALQWEAATDNVAVTSYRVLRGTTIVATGITTTTYADTTVAANTNYSYTVQALDAAGNIGPASTALAVRTPAPPDTTAPTAPRSLTATQNAYNRVALQWVAATDNVAVTSYRVLRGTTVIATGITTTTYADSTVAANTNYSYTVQALDAAGNIGPASTALAVRTPAPPDTTPPSVPTNFRATASTVVRVTLQWQAATDNVGVTSYRVLRGTTVIATVTTPTYADATVSPNTSYTYRVQAVDAAGNVGTATTNLPVRTPADTQAPSVPARPTGTAGVRSVTLQWPASTDNVRVTGYSVYRGTTRVANVTSTSYVVTGLTANTTYSFTVRAFDAVGNTSAASAAVSVRAR